jgi:hypothetical protein
VPDEAYAEVPQIVGRQLRQYRGIDRVVAKRLIVLLHPEAVEPGCDVHARLPAASLAASDHLTRDYGLRARKSAQLVAVRRHAVHRATIALQSALLVSEHYTVPTPSTESGPVVARYCKRVR